MIIIVQRSDLSRMYTDLEPDTVGLQHFGMSVEKTQKAELIVFINRSKVYVLKADSWPKGKPMSAAELLQYIANHVA
jgi:hypothetical protein